MGSKSSTQKTENNPPKWAEPLLSKGAGEAMRLYNEGKGYGVYTGPTQAQFSPTTLQGMNSLLAATGGGSPITNASVFNNPQIQQARQVLAEQAAQKSAAPVAKQTGPGTWIEQTEMRRNGGGREGGMSEVTYYVNSQTGQRKNALSADEMKSLATQRGDRKLW